MIARRIAQSVSAIALLALSARAQAAQTNRIAVEAKAGESPMETAFVYEDACLRMGAAPERLRPAESFKVEEAEFVRIEVTGPQPALHCLAAVAGRSTIDGTVLWPSGPPRALLRHPEHEAEALPDERWFGIGKPITSPRPKVALVDALISGAAAAREELVGTPLDESLADVGSLSTRGSAAGLAVLEKIAAEDSRWPVRRYAALSLDASIAGELLIDRAQHDPAWEVRLALTSVLARIAISFSPHAGDAGHALVQLVRTDTDWAVQRQAIWAMPAKLATKASATLTEVVHNKSADRRVRAIALETLAGTGQATDTDILAAVADPAPEVRAIGAEVIAANPTEATAPLLWKALHDQARIVRLAAGPFLDRIDDASIPPKLWDAFEFEAIHLDADIAFEKTVLDTMVRHPFPSLAEKIEKRIQSQPRPRELHLLQCALTALTPGTTFDGGINGECEAARQAGSRLETALASGAPAPKHRSSATGPALLALALLLAGVVGVKLRRGEN